MVGEVWRNCNQILGASNALPFKPRVCNPFPIYSSISWFHSVFSQVAKTWLIGLVPILPNSMYLSPSTRNGEQCENVTKPIVKSSGGRRVEITRRGSRSMRGDQGAIGCHFITENIGPTTVHSQGPFLEIRRNSVVSVSAQPVFSLSNGTHLTA